MSICKVLSIAIMAGCCLQSAGCAADEADGLTGEAARDPAAQPSTPEEVASAAEEPGCANPRFDVAVTGDAELDAELADEAVSLMRAESADGERPELEEREAQACGMDYYFHPSNGSHGGYINAYRLCYEGWDAGRNMGRYRICTGGSAPVRYWNPESCNGAVHNYYPQGWSGYARTAGGCC